MIHFSLFSGVGGFDLASEWMGWKNYLSCEINEFGNRVLEYYWPNAYHHKDIHTLTYDTIHTELSKRYGAGWRDDDIILTGGFPCQPYSVAGKRKGKEDERHLWPEMLRVIREVAPTYIVGENVGGLLTWDGGLVFEEVQTDLEAEGYEVQSFLLPAAGVNAPHKRDRLWIVAKNTERNGCLQRESKQEGTDVRELGDVGSGSADGIYIPEGDAPKSCCKRCHDGGDNREGRHIQTDQRITEKSESERQGRERRAREISENASNTAGLRQQGQRESKRPINTTKDSQWQANRINSVDEVGRWEGFPTQSPVRSRDDGFPYLMASESIFRELRVEHPREPAIGYAKWRNESIKAMGNAIVPHVALQIFKAIEKTC